MIDHAVIALQPAQRHLPPMFSLAEAAKVSVKYNEETSKRKGVVRDPSAEEPPVTFISRIGIPTLKPIERVPLESDTKSVGKPNVTQIFPSSDQSSVSRTKEDKSRGGRVFLKRGAATKEKMLLKQDSVRLPVLPKRAKLESIKTGSKKKGLDDNKNSDVTDIESDTNDVIKPLPLISDASATFQAVFRYHQQYQNSFVSTF